MLKSLPKLEALNVASSGLDLFSLNQRYSMML